MDPLTAFSLVAAILQVVDVSSRAVGQCRQLYKNGALADHNDTREVTSALAKPQSPDDVEIVDLSKKCSKLTKDLLEELQKLSLKQTGLWQAISKTVRAFRQKGSLKEKQDLLEKYQRVLNTRILCRLDARSLQETQDIHSLDQAVRDLATGLQQGHGTVEQLLASHSQELKDYFDSRFESHAQATQNRLTYQRLLESLFFPEIVARQEQIPEAYQETCRWIFHDPVSEQSGTRPRSNFRKWLETNNDVYWISGKPGSGKSTLMKYIVKEGVTKQLLDRWKQGSSLLIVSFFFWNAGTALQKSYTGFLRSLLYQIARQWPEMVDLIDENSGKRMCDLGVARSPLPMATWTDHRLLSLLKRFLDKKPSEVSLCAFVDGLDEFVGDEDSILEVVRLFRETSRCKICVSSRPEQAFRQEFPTCYQLRAQDLNYKDIVLTANGRLISFLNESYHLPENDSAVASLVKLLIDKASGVFLWLDLMIKDLIRGSKNGDTFDELQLRLERTPDTINGMYARMLQGLDPLYKEEALKNFQILIVAKELGISVNLLTFIMSEGEPWEHISQFDTDYFSTPRFHNKCRASELRIVSRCCSLIEIQESEEDEEDDEDEEDFNFVQYHNRHVDFVHRTAMDYIQKEHRLLPLTSSSQRSTLGLLARGCIGSLTLRPEEIILPTLKGATLAIRALGVTTTSSDEDDSQSQLLQIDLINTAIQLLRHLDLWQSLPGDGPPDATFDLRSFVMSLYLEECFIKSGDALDFAAFFGCNLYVKSALSTGVFARERISSLLLTAVSGLDLDHFHSPFACKIPGLTRLWTIQEIVQRDFDPNEIVLTDAPFLRGGFFEPLMRNSFILGTMWTIVFFKLLVIFEYCPLDSWETIGRDIIARLLTLGADPNTHIVFKQYVYHRPAEEFVLFSDLSLLEFWARLEQHIRSRIPSIDSILQSAGCVRHSEVRYLMHRGLHYPVTQVQSQQIMKEIASRPLWVFKVWRKFFDKGDATENLGILADIATGDPIDEETVMRYFQQSKESF
ncbi:MAG: hypothetical protein Q9210_005353 [Variospora velana]